MHSYLSSFFICYSLLVTWSSLKHIVKFEPSMVHSNEMAQKCAPRQNSINQSTNSWVYLHLITFNMLPFNESSGHRFGSSDLKSVWYYCFCDGDRKKYGWMIRHFIRCDFTIIGFPIPRQLPHKTNRQERMNMFCLIQTDVYKQNGHMCNM